jgi:integrase
MIDAYLDFARGYYRHKDGTPTSESPAIKSAMARLRTYYGSLPCNDFGPRKLRKLVDKMKDEKLARGTINGYVKRLKMAFKWATSEELIDPSVFHGLFAVGGLRRFRGGRETAPVRPVSQTAIDAAVERLSPVVAAMVRLHVLLGCRPGELCLMRPCDIDRTGEVWEYRPERHKTQYAGHTRVIAIGPQAQEILRPFLERAVGAYCFCPREAWQAGGYNPPGDCYLVSSYRVAVGRACKRAGITPWTPNQLRHTTATRIRRRFGIEAAQAILGHADADVTLVYAEKDQKLAADVARAMG